MSLLLQSFYSRSLIIITTLSAVLLAGCFTLDDGRQQEGEPATAADAPAPTGYTPLFIRSTRPVAEAVGKPKILLQSVDVSKPDKIKFYLHITDISYSYLTGAKSSSLWCLTRETFNDASKNVKTTVRETTIGDNIPHAIALVMDHSGSMGEERALAIQDAADRIIGLKKSEDALTLIKYDDNIRVESYLSADPSELRSRLRKDGLIGMGGYTAIIDGIAAGMDQISSANNYKRKAVVIFTDGMDNSSTKNRDSLVAVAKRLNIAICAVDFGYGVNDNFLQKIAEETGGAYNRIYSTADFNAVFEDMYQRLRNYYVMEYSPNEYGKHSFTVKICLPTGEDSVTVDFDNTPDVGSIALLNIYFDSDKAMLKSESKPALDNISTLMKILPAMAIEVRGHTDSTNRTKDKDYNLKLSQKRADAVKEYLVKAGFAGDRIKAVGFGDSMPVDDNGTEEGRARNRRTEFIITKK
ncbi:hypothetical protein MASR2M18_11430 [Ignavibacteria bacterium]|nr:OmpA family protein [Bacteroidota bacterium]MCZ2132564.1 OmpA family protein [Bacteroidota bacterium]